MSGVKSQGEMICPDVLGVRGVESSGQDPKTYYVLIPAPILVDAKLVLQFHCMRGSVKESCTQTCANVSSVR